MDLGFKIVDSHTHLVLGEKNTTIKDQYIAENGVERWNKLQALNRKMDEKFLRVWNFPPNDTSPADYHVVMDKWIAEMDRNNIERMVMLTGGGNDILSNAVKLYPDRFVGYAHHHPCDKDAAEKLEYAITRQGLKGYKIFATFVDIPFNDPSLKPVWLVAEKYKIPITIHFGVKSGLTSHPNMNPIVLHDVARSYPDIPFIVPHFGCGFPQDALFLCWGCPNVYIDTSSSLKWVNWMPYPLTAKDLYKKFYETIGPERMMFGTDSDYFPRGFAAVFLQEQYRICVELGFKEEDIKNIFRNNILRLLNLL